MAREELERAKQSQRERDYMEAWAHAQQSIEATIKALAQYSKVSPVIEGGETHKLLETYYRSPARYLLAEFGDHPVRETVREALYMANYL